MPLNVTAIPLILEFERQEGYPKNSLLDVMLFETAGTLDTKIKNKYSGAVGLIQWLPSTLAAMGYSVAQVERMSVTQQLGLVREYLSPYRSRLLASRDPLDFYMAVLYPALLGKPDTAIMTANTSSALYLQNKGLDIDKDGDIQKGDIRRWFIQKVNAIRASNSIPKQINMVGLLLLAISALYIVKKTSH